ncbi:hypothetical protein NUITMVRA1_17480 [Aerococcus viridans]|nr:hypothetical protein NUITMVRA1_17480 [Aerococcus viridans]
MLIHEKYFRISQNVNFWRYYEFIRLWIQYGTEISKEVEYESIYKSKRHFSLMWGMSFFVFL